MTDETYTNNGLEREKRTNDGFSFNMSTLQFITNKKGEIIDVSDAFCQKVGFLKEELLGVALEDTGLLTEESRKKILYRNVSRLVGKEKTVFMLDVKTHEGGFISLEIDTKPYIKKGEIVGEIGIVRKIVPLNETRRAEENQPQVKQQRMLSVESRPDLEKIIKERREVNNRIESELDSIQNDLQRKELHKINEQLRRNMIELEEKRGQELRARNDEIRRTEEELVNTKGEVETLRSEVEIRSRLLDDLEHQILERQTQLVEKIQTAKRLQTELESR
ncbi:MAG: PAS domain S-box protein, partial [Thermoplasmata archaeon]|nr:PAS domain S-box protein [Thermoplasmata archaeon]